MVGPVDPGAISLAQPHEKFDGVSAAMADTKLDNARATGASHIVACDMSCLMHLDGYIRNKNYQLKTLHIADVLASGW